MIADRATSDAMSPAPPGEASAVGERTTRAVTVASALAVVAVGGCVMTGWLTGQTAWARLGIDGPVMVFNTALLFVVTAAAIIALAYRRFTAMHVLGGAVTLVAAVTAIQLPTGANYGIDELFFKNSYTELPFAAARMSINSAICFSLLGLALLAMRPPGRQGWRFFAAAMLASAALAIATVALIGHTTGLAAASGWGGHYGMAAPTAVCVALCAAALMAWAALFHTQLRFPLSKWFPFIVGNCAIVGTFGLWHALVFQDHERIEVEVRNQFEDLHGDLVYALRHHEGVLMRMGKRWDSGGGTTEMNWRDDAKNYLEALKGFEALAWVDSDLDVRWMEVSAKGDYANTVATDGAVRGTIRDARRKRLALAVILPSRDAEGTNVWLCQPVSRDGADDGCLLAVFDMHRLMTENLQRLPMPGQSFTIGDQQEILFQSEPTVLNGATALAQSAELAFANLRWTITDVPSRAWVATRRSALPDVTLGAGLLLAILLIATLQLAVKARDSLRLASISEARFRAIVSNAPLGISVVDELGRFVQTNAPLQQILGRTEEQLRGRSFAEFTHPDDLDHTWTAYRQLVAGETSSLKLEIRTRGTAGDTKWLSVYSAALPDADGARLTIGMVSDVTERVLAEKRLAVQYQVARILRDDAPTSAALSQVLQHVCELLDWDLGAVWTLIAADKHSLHPFVIWGQPSMEAAEFIHSTQQFTFVSGEGLPGRVWQSREATWIEDFFKDSNCPRAELAMVCGLHSAIAIPIQFQNEFHGVIEFFAKDVLRPDDVLLDMLASLGGQLGQFFQRKASEQRLRETLTLQQAILDNADRSIITSTPDGLIQIFNQAAARMLGYTPEEMIGKYTPAAFHDVEEIDARAKELSLELGRDVAPGYDVFVAKPLLGVAEEREWTYVRKDGSQFPVLLSVTTFRDATGNITGYLGIANDISEQKRVEEQLLLARQAADDANKAKSEFLANMSHEIRTPMNGVIGMTNLVLTTPLSSLQKEYINAIKESGDALLTVINDILDFSKVEAGMLDLEEIDFNLHDKLNSTMRALSTRAQEKGIALLDEVDPAVPVWIVGDPGRLRQIIVNLVGNAIKFTDQGGVALRVSIDELAGEDEQGRLLHFAVSDTGIGIPLEKQRLIFDPFSQADTSTTRQFGGTGLGLTICTRLVRLMGGTIWVESEVGRGSTFHFTARLNAPTTGVSGAVAAPALMPRHQSLHILVAEDNAINRLVAIRILELAGHSVTVAVNGQDAVAALADAEFDVVLMDVQMPILDGFQAAAAIRTEETITGGHMPLVAMTAHAMKGDQERCLAAGMDAYVSKPIEEEELFLAIEKAMTGKRSPTVAAAGPSVDLAKDIAFRNTPTPRIAPQPTGA